VNHWSFAEAQRHEVAARLQVCMPSWGGLEGQGKRRESNIGGEGVSRDTAQINWQTERQDHPQFSQVVGGLIKRGAEKVIQESFRERGPNTGARPVGKEAIG